jgi:hypothetical protein
MISQSTCIALSAEFLTSDKLRRNVKVFRQEHVLLRSIAFISLCFHQSKQKCEQVGVRSVQLSPNSGGRGCIQYNENFLSMKKILYIAILLLSIALSVVALFTRFVYWTDSSEDVAFGGAKLEYHMGLHSFQFRMVDDGGDLLNNAIFSRDWTVETYDHHCSSSRFFTRTNHRLLIDSRMFCDPNSVWALIRRLAYLTVGMDLISISILIAFELLKEGKCLLCHSVMSNGDSHKQSCYLSKTGVFCLFKHSLLANLLLNGMVFGAICFLLSRLLFNNLILLPNQMYFHIGYFLFWANFASHSILVLVLALEEDPRKSSLHEQV